MDYKTYGGVSQAAGDMGQRGSGASTSANTISNVLGSNDELLAMLTSQLPRLTQIANRVSGEGPEIDKLARGSDAPRPPESVLGTLVRQRNAYSDLIVSLTRQCERLEHGLGSM